jgi:ABC-2 type transport system ATP-binding protein
MIQVEGLRKRYGDLRAVDGVSFEVAEGELFGFLGPNGAGKTTVLSMISGLLRPDSGSVRVDGIDVWENPKQAKSTMGLVPQEVALYEELTASENLEFWGGLYDLPRRQLRDNIREILEYVGLSDRAKERVSKFSGGMKRRLNLAVGLVHKPAVVLLDEPTVGIDPQARNNILEIVRNIAHSGTTVLFTTHHLEEAEVLCERIAILDHGKVLEMGTVQELAKTVADGNIVTIRGGFTPSQFKAAFQDEKVAVVSVSAHVATLRLEHDMSGVTAVIQRLNQSGIEITDLSIQKPSLESVFLSLTGRELRD